MKTVADLDFQQVRAVLARLSLELVRVEPGADIPGSWWGAPEAGIIRSRVYVRDDTPVHSLLHETCHSLCMSDERRARLHTDAGGDYDEENAVCYLQILLADRLDGYDRHACMSDMDEWGYTFRLGSASRWFHEDASECLDWLQTRKPDLLAQTDPRATRERGAPASCRQKR